MPLASPGTPCILRHLRTHGTHPPPARHGLNGGVQATVAVRTGTNADVGGGHGSLAATAISTRTRPARHPTQRPRRRIVDPFKPLTKLRFTGGVMPGWSVAGWRISPGGIPPTWWQPSSRGALGSLNSLNNTSSSSCRRDFLSVPDVMIRTCWRIARRSLSRSLIAGCRAGPLDSVFLRIDHFGTAAVSGTSGNAWCAGYRDQAR